jgi:hypothetical protein
MEFIFFRAITQIKKKKQQKHWDQIKNINSMHDNFCAAFFLERIKREYKRQKESPLWL